MLILKIYKNELKNKKILITGATGGIGNSLVKKFNDLELKIVATGTNEQKLEKLKKILKIFTLKSLGLTNMVKLKNLLIK